MITILNWIKNLFNGATHQGDLENFVASKRPTNTAEVEYWVTVYQQKNTGWL